MAGGDCEKKPDCPNSPTGEHSMTDQYAGKVKIGARCGYCGCWTT